MAGFGEDFGASGAEHAAGLVPDPGATPGTSRFLREDGWADLPATPTSVYTFVGETLISGDATDQLTIDVPTGFRALDVEAIVFLTPGYGGSALLILAINTGTTDGEPSCVWTNENIATTGATLWFNTDSPLGSANGITLGQVWSMNALPDGEGYQYPVCAVLRARFMYPAIAQPGVNSYAGMPSVEGDFLTYPSAVPTNLAMNRFQGIYQTVDPLTVIRLYQYSPSDTSLISAGSRIAVYGVI